MTLLRPFGFSGSGVLAAVTTRHGGVSEGPYATLNLGDHVGDDPARVRHNRDRLAEALSVPAVTFMDQQHTANVAVVDQAAAGRGHGGAADAADAFPRTDALVTAVPGAALAVMVADCAPVVLFDPVQRAAAVAHCGRGGTVAGLLPATVSALATEFGSRPADLRVGIGPCIGGASYEVGPAEVEDVRSAFPGLDLLAPTREGRACLDLLVALRHQLAVAGVPDEQVEVMGQDTRTNAGVWFSDRAERPCGRFAAVVRLDEQA